MLHNTREDLDPGTYDIVFGVTYDNGSGLCTTQIIITDPCEDPSVTITINDPPVPAFPDKTYTLGDPEMVILSWTWPQIFTQSVPSPVICLIYLEFTTSIDGGPYLEVDFKNMDVWSEGDKQLSK